MENRLMHEFDDGTILTKRDIGQSLVVGMLLGAVMCGGIMAFDWWKDRRLTNKFNTTFKPIED